LLGSSELRSSRRRGQTPWRGKLLCSATGGQSVVEGLSRRRPTRIPGVARRQSIHAPAAAVSSTYRSAIVSGARVDCSGRRLRRGWRCRGSTGTTGGHSRAVAGGQSRGGGARSTECRGEEAEQGARWGIWGRGCFANLMRLVGCWRAGFCKSSPPFFLAF
jgi:hypothetical protein